MYHKFDMQYCMCSFQGMHNCLVPVTLCLAIIFNSIRRTAAIPGNICAVNMQNMLLMLPFLLQNLLEQEVEEYNSQNPFDPVTDPSDECIGIVLSLTEWYHLYRCRFPPKDEVDIQDLQELSIG